MVMVQRMTRRSHDMLERECIDDIEDNVRLLFHLPFVFIVNSTQSGISIFLV